MQKATGSSKVHLWHQKRRAEQPAKATPNSEPAGTTVATDSPECANGHGGASEQRTSGAAACDTSCQTRRGGAGDGCFGRIPLNEMSFESHANGAFFFDLFECYNRKAEVERKLSREGMCTSNESIWAKHMEEARYLEVSKTLGAQFRGTGATSYGPPSQPCCVHTVRHLHNTAMPQPATPHAEQHLATPPTHSPPPGSRKERRQHPGA